VYRTPTNIQVDDKTKEKLRSFGAKGESYQDIINKLYDIAIKDQLREFQRKSNNTISLEKARMIHARKWSKLK